MLKGKRSIPVAQNRPAPPSPPDTYHSMNAPSYKVDTQYISKGGKMQSQSPTSEVDPSIFVFLYQRKRNDNQL